MKKNLSFSSRTPSPFTFTVNVLALTPGLNVTLTVPTTGTKSEPARADSCWTQYLSVTVLIGKSESEIVKLKLV